MLQSKIDTIQCEDTIAVYVPIQLYESFLPYSGGAVPPFREGRKKVGSECNEKGRTNDFTDFLDIDFKEITGLYYPKTVTTSLRLPPRLRCSQR